MNILIAIGPFMGMLLLASCLFHILYLQAAAPPLAWFVALRYILATTALAFFVPGIIYLIARPGSQVRRAVIWLIGLITYYCLTVVVGDLVYYGQAGKHSTVELMLYYQNIIDVSLMAFKDYTYIPIVYLIAGILFFFLWKRIVRREVPVKPGERAGRYWLRAAGVGAYAITCLVCARGGFQGRPLRPADAFVSLTQANGDFALNGIYTSFYAIFHRSQFPVAGHNEAILRARSIVAGRHDVFLTESMPFYRISREPRTQKKNVVFIILESWSARRVGTLGDKTGATPFFDSLARDGWLFTQAYATGRRSIASLPSAISSIPTLYGSLYITSPHEQNFQRGMGSLFHSAGYSTYFTYAAKAGSMGFNAFARLAGFGQITTREDFAPDAPNDGVWGIYDDVMFRKVLADLNQAKRPFLSVVYTLHPHPPFVLPQGNNWYDASMPRSKYYNALRYSDESLRQFFTAARSAPWYRDTVFILMADHAFEEKQGADSYHIPLLVYAPGFVPPRRDDRIASELDVLPTILSLLRLNVAHASMGKSLLEPGPRYAFIDAEHAGGFITRQSGETLALLFGAEKYLGYYNMSNDPEWKILRKNDPLPGDQMAALRDYIGVMGYAIARNRIAPAN